MIYNNEQIRKLYYTKMVAITKQCRDDDVPDAVKRRSASFDRMKRAFSQQAGLPVSIYDLVPSSSPIADRPDLMLWKIMWSPSSKMARFVGGPCDAQVVEHKDAGGEIHIDSYALQEDFYKGYDSLELGTMMDKIITTTYLMRGWDSDRREWIYAPR